MKRVFKLVVDIKHQKGNATDEEIITRLRDLVRGIGFVGDYYRMTIEDVQPMRKKEAK